MSVRVLVPTSGGKDSQACLKLALQRYAPHEVRALFCDTQWEHPITLAHVERLRTLYGPVRIDTVTGGSVLEKSIKYGRFPGEGSLVTNRDAWTLAERVHAAIASAPQASQPPQGAEPQTRPLSEVIAEFEASSPENKARMLAARERRDAQTRPGDAPPQGASSLLPEQERVALVEKCALEVVGFCNQFGDEATDRLMMLRSQLAASPLPAPQEPAMTEAQALVIADKYGQRWKASDEEGISFEKSHFFMFLAALLAASLYAAPAPDSTP